MSDKLEKLYQDLSGLTVLEISELVKLLEDKWGVSAAAAMPAFAMPAAGSGAAAAEPVEEKTEFDVILAEAAAPKAIKEAVSKAEAEEIKKKVEAAGAKVEVK